MSEPLADPREHAGVDDRLIDEAIAAARLPGWGGACERWQRAGPRPRSSGFSRRRRRRVEPRRGHHEAHTGRFGRLIRRTGTVPDPSRRSRSSSRMGSRFGPGFGPNPRSRRSWQVRCRSCRRSCAAEYLVREFCRFLPTGNSNGIGTGSPVCDGRPRESPIAPTGPTRAPCGSPCRRAGHRSRSTSGHKSGRCRRSASPVSRDFATQVAPRVVCQVTPIDMVDSMTSRSDQATVAVELPTGLPRVTPAAARLLAVIVLDGARETPVIELRFGRPDEPPEAVAS